MIATLVDSNIWLDIMEDDPVWGNWSSLALAQHRDRSRLVINPIIFAEISVGFATIEVLEALLPPGSADREPLPWEAAFLAGKCFQTYRQRGGTRRSPLPDFYIGAHAAVRGYRLLTRDARRYRTYFPKLEIVAPESA